MKICINCKTEIVKIIDLRNSKLSYKRDDGEGIPRFKGVHRTLKPYIHG